MPADQDPSDGGQSFPCSQCGAKLNYDAGTRAMRCPYCGHQEEAPTGQVPGAVREIPLEEGLRLATRGLGTPVTAVSCNDCGATVNVSPGEQTAKCAFCGSHQVLAQEASGNLIRPESMIPFKMDKAASNVRFSGWLAGLWFRPNDLKAMAKVQEMGGVYIPYWTFDALVRSQWSAEAGYHYYVSETYTDAQGNQQTRQVQRTRWQHASGHRQDFYDDVLVCASKGLPENLVKQFSTFQTTELVPYQPALLAGWRAESYALDLMPAWSKGEQTMTNEQRAKCSRDVPGDTQRNLNVHNQFSNRTFKHVLLPIWIAAYRYKGKPYQFLVNGQTGEVVGKAPYSFWKIFFFCLFIAALVTVAVVLYNNYDPKKNQPVNTLTPPAAVAPQADPMLAPQPTATPKPVVTPKPLPKKK